MTLPHARKVVVAGKTYPYTLKFSKGNLIGETGGIARLVIQTDAKAYFATDFRSKHWTGDHANGEWWAPTHKVAFKPSDVVAVIQALADGRLPEGFELPDWAPV